AAAIDAMMETIKDDLAALDVRHDVFFSERSLISGDRDEVRAMVEGRHPDGLGIPPAGAIASHLIRFWAEAAA
ncbi:MAG: hypothetical protein F9K43_25790, partial [Bauldia sp.]